MMTETKTSKIYRVLNVEHHEKQTVLQLFMHHFFQGFGIALLFIIANSLFLANFSIKELPWVYIGSGLLVMASGRIYAGFEHHYPIDKLLKGVVITIVALLLLLWSSSLFLSLAFFSLILLISYQLFYLLYNLEFWALSALVFNVRQSKRLFGLISSGDMPAKMLGYLTVSIISSFLSLNYLLLLAAISVAASYYFLLKILRNNDLKEKNSRDLLQEFDNRSSKKNPLSYLRRFFRTRFIFTAAFLSLVAVITFTMVNFSFLAEVKYKFKSDQELASFFGIFFAAGQFFIIVTKAFFSGRFIKALGIRKALLLLPLSIIAILMLSFFFRGTVADKALLYIFGFLMLTTDIFKYSLHQPVFLSLFQPLNAHLRLHGHTVIKGFVDGFALLAGGSLILLLLKSGSQTGLFTFGIFILILAILWVALVFRTDHHYLSMLKEAINTRRLTGLEYHFGDGRLEKNVVDQIKNGKTWESIYGLRILQKSNSSKFDDLCNEAIKRNNNDLTNWVISHANDSHLKENLDYYKALISRNEYSDYNKASFINRLSQNDEDAFIWAQPFMTSGNKTIEKAAIEGLLKGKSIEGMVMAGNRLLALRDSEEVPDQIMLSEIIRDLSLKNFDSIIEKQLESDDFELFNSALVTAQSIKTVGIFNKIIAHFEKYAAKSWFLEKLIVYEADAVAYFTNNLDQFKTSKTHLESIIFICKKYANQSTFNLLLSDPFLYSTELRQLTFQSLSSLDFNEELPDELQSKIQAWLNKEYRHLNFLIHFQSGENGLKKMIELEISHTQKRLFDLLSLKYRNKQISLAKEAFFSHYSNKKANALEMLEGLFQNKQDKKIIRILENKVNPNQGIKHESIVHYGLQKGGKYFSCWSVATMLFEERARLENIQVENAISSENNSLIIRQAYQHHSNPKSDRMRTKTNQAELLEIEKVSLLKASDLFSNTPDNLLVDLASVLNTIQLNEGDILFEQGDPGDCMYIVYSGSIEIKDGQKHLATFGELDFFGELSLLDDEPRSASAIALSDCLLLSISQDDFYELISFRQEVAKSVLRVLSQRLRKQNKS